LRSLATFVCLVGFLVLNLAPVRAGDAEIVEAVKKAAVALDQAFERQDKDAVKRLMTSDHIAVTPYYDGPQTVDDQLASLPELKYRQTLVGEVAFSFLGPTAAMRNFTAKLDGSFEGKPIPPNVYVTEIWAKSDGAWQEKFYQVTALRPAHAGKFAACKELAGTYLTKNSAKGGRSENFTSRSVISIGRSGLMLFTDSGEGGEAGFAPFTDARGTWRCISEDASAPKVRATTLDFTVPTADNPHAQIGRLDFEIGYDAENKTIKGSATLYLIPLGDDPLVPGELEEGRQFEIVGQRVEAP
jgi:hypothetical protein